MHRRCGHAVHFQGFILACGGGIERCGGGSVFPGELGSVLKLISFLGFLLGAAVAVLTDLVAGGLILAGAFLISPFGLPLLANWLLDRMADLNFALRDFITS